MERARLVLSIAAISAALSSSARAQNVDAEALFNDGDSLMKQGKTAEACDAFEASNRLEARAGTLIRLGECREKNQQLASAWSAYKDALTRAKDPKKRELANAKVKMLQPRLSYLTINVAERLDGLTIARNGQILDQALWNRGVPVNGGEYTIVARAPGKQDSTTTTEVPNERGKVVVEIPKLQARAGTAEPLSPTTKERAEKPAPSTFTTKRKIAVAFGGVAVAGLIGGIVLGIQAKSKENEAYDLCPNPNACPDAARANSLIDAGQSWALGANIAFGVAGTFAVGAAVLWFTGSPSTSSSVAVVPGPGSFAVIGRF